MNIVRAARRTRPTIFYQATLPLSTSAVNPASSSKSPPPAPATTSPIISSPSSSTTSSTSSAFNWLRKFAGFYGDESTAIRHSHAMFESCHAVSTQEHLLPHFSLEDDFIHRHALINLHVWMVHNRLRSGGKNVDSEGKVMQEQLYDRFWENTTERIRALGVPELTVNKHLKETQSLSFGSAMSFDINMRESKDHLAGM